MDRWPGGDWAKMEFKGSFEGVSAPAMQRERSVKSKSGPPGLGQKQSSANGCFGVNQNTGQSSASFQ